MLRQSRMSRVSLGIFELEKDLSYNAQIWIFSLKWCYSTDPDKSLTTDVEETYPLTSIRVEDLYWSSSLVLKSISLHECLVNCTTLHEDRRNNKKGHVITFCRDMSHSTSKVYWTCSFFFKLQLGHDFSASHRNQYRVRKTQIKIEDIGHFEDVQVWFTSFATHRDPPASFVFRVTSEEDRSCLRHSISVFNDNVEGPVMTHVWSQSKCSIIIVHRRYRLLKLFVLTFGWQVQTLHHQHTFVEKSIRSHWYGPTLFDRTDTDPHFLIPGCIWFRDRKDSLLPWTCTTMISMQT